MNNTESYAESLDIS